MTVAAFTALGLALLNRMLRKDLLSKLSERVTFVLIPPLVLIFLVLGTIFLGVATPTEGGAMGAVGALIMATGRRRLTLPLLKQALVNTTRLSCFVMFILIGSTVFSFTFNAAEGHYFVEALFKDMPGGALGFLIVVNILVFILGCFIDFFEIAFIVIPLLAPVADKILPELLPAGTPPEWTLIWFGVIVAMNLQTSFLTPPFGFALFYLRSVAPRRDYSDRLTGARINAVTTPQIYKGGIAFIVIQLLMLGVVIAFPGLVISDQQKTAVDLDKIELEAPSRGYGEPVPEPSVPPPADGKPEAAPVSPEEASEDDPMEAVRRALQNEAKK
jgi:tripartite ATP-independent transporter DctM subunit